MSIAHSRKHMGQLNSLFCDRLMLCLSTGVDVREVQPYMNTMEMICIAGLLVEILILYLMSEYGNLLLHATLNNQPTQLRKLDHPKCANGKYWSRVRYFQQKLIKYQTEHSKARSWLHQSREGVKEVTTTLYKMTLPPLRLVGRCISGLCKMLLAPLKLIRRCIWRNKSDTQTAHADSQYCDPKGGNNNRVNKQGLQAQQSHGTIGLYIEHQVKKFCQVHALNAMLGRNAVQLETMLKFCEEHAKDNTALGKQLRLGIGWCSRDGNFGDMMIDIFLHFHSVPSTRLYSVAQNIPVGSDADMYLRGLPADQNAFVLRWYCGNMPHEDPAYGHAVCVEQHPINKQWYLLDSEKRQPVRLDDAGWHTLKGTVCIFAKGGAYHHNTLPGAAAEGYTQCLNVSDFISPGEVGITTSATTELRPAPQTNELLQCIRLDQERACNL